MNLRFAHAPQGSALCFHTVHVFDSPSLLARAAASRIALLAKRAACTQPYLRIALAGGATPQACYAALRDESVDWSRIHIYFGDERCLPASDLRRNDRMAALSLLDHVPIPDSQIHRIQAHWGAVPAALDYAECLRQSGPLDLVILGMGEDGHTASLFPGLVDPQEHRLAIPVLNAPKPPAQRVSLGPAALLAARQVMFLVTGRAKHRALQRLVCGAPLPPQQFKLGHWYVDRAAWHGDTHCEAE